MKRSGSNKDFFKGLRVAILIDGSFFLKRYRFIYGRKPPDKVAADLFTFAMRHVEDDYLYRLLFYDCRSLDKKAHNPITGKAVDFSKTDEYKWRMAFYDHLKKKRKVALRLGFVSSNNNWLIKPIKTKELLEKKIEISDLSENDVYFEMRQKGVDIKIGTDITSMALKRAVDKIILVSGDSDFVPAAKQARREGIDFLLDPMWNHINPDLFEHIDGLRSTCDRPGPPQLPLPQKTDPLSGQAAQPDLPQRRLHPLLVLHPGLLHQPVLPGPRHIL